MNEQMFLELRAGMVRTLAVASKLSLEWWRGDRFTGVLWRNAMGDCWIRHAPRSINASWAVVPARARSYMPYGCSRPMSS